MDKPRREAILDLSKYVDERIRVKFTGGREGASFSPVVNDPFPLTSLAVTGVLKGYDQLLNLVLDEVEEQLEGKRYHVVFPPLTDPNALLIAEPEPHTRKLGLVVLRGPTITLLSPVDGLEEIANPFAQE
jgi:U6 snRNA-associated Sm-like protein LSm7